MRSHIRRLLESAGFSPRQLFAALQGAWYEPTTDTCFTDTAGTTPATLGQAVARINDRSGMANNATQATVANRPLLSARYNLLTKTEDFSDAVWVTQNGAVKTPNYAVAPDGQQTALKVEIQNKNSDYFFQNISAHAGYYSLTFWAKTESGTNTFTVSNSSVGTLTLNTTWTRYSATVTHTGGPINIYPVLLNSNGNFFLWHPDLRLASTPASYPAYQRVNTATDYDTTGFPVKLVHDATDVLTASLPSINVRRNLLTYSEQFDNAAWQISSNAWVANAIIGPFGGTAYKLVETANTSSHNTYRTDTVNAGTVVSFYAKAAERSHVTYVQHGVQGVFIAPTFNLSTGTVSQSLNTSTATYTPTITPVGNGWYRCAVALTSLGNLGTGTALRIGLADSATPPPGNYGLQSYTGDGTSGIYLWGAQLELGSVATDYQKITDWTSEAFASSGSVYFSTPVGMSQLNNQSMGATYTLPALSSDIFSWIVVPQRLSAVQESRLALYMQQKAGIAGPDYLLDTADGQLTDDAGDLIFTAQ